MGVFNLTFATTRATILILRQALTGDPLFQPDRTGPSRSGETIVRDAWGMRVRDYPILVVTGIPGKNRRMAFGDKVRDFFGVTLIEEAGGTNVLRTFDVNSILLPEVTEPETRESRVELRYVGANADDLQPQKSPFILPVQQKTVGPNVVKFIELAGTNVGPEAVFQLKDFEASTLSVPTGTVFGGWYDMTIQITGCARSTQERELLMDKVWSILWFTKKRELRKKGIVVLDVAHAGFAQEPYGADQLYFSRFNVSVGTEFEAIAQFTETVEEITVQGNAVSVNT